MPRGHGRRCSREGGAGELPVERRGHSGHCGTQTVPEQERGEETGSSREAAPLPLHRLREDVRQVVPPQSAPAGPHR